ncbi:epimerase [Gottfriedia solisilvae]|uniref:epimerase n=1 Tax=Gottfriedia solisilvae TaxID=1516104 RepID=UPI003D2F4C3C
MSKNGLDLFGKLLMNNIRDEAIDDWERIIEGKMRDEESQNIYKMLSDNERELVKSLIPKIVDTTIHHLLWTIEQEEFIKVKVNDGTQYRNINKISDGLAGELYTEDGWISRFSKKTK